MPLDETDPRIREKLDRLRRLEAEATEEQRRAKAAADAETRRLEYARLDIRRMIPHVIRDEETNEAIQLHAIHHQWIDHLYYCWSHGLHCGILAPRGYGKCMDGKALVQLADGRRVTHEELCGTGFEVLAFDEQSLEYVAAPARCVSNGLKPIRTITLWSGRQLNVTENHPFWTIHGWRRADELKKDDFVAVARRLPELGATSILRPGEAALLGYFVGDGCCVRSGTSIQSSLTNGDQMVVEAMESYARSLGFSIVVGKGCKDWLREHGLAEKNAHTKRVPSSIWTARNADVASFLGAYFNCDGTVSRHLPLVEYYSVSRELLQDVQSLLLRFGIGSYIRRKLGMYQGERHVSWRLQITGSENLKRFVQFIPVCGHKHEALEKLNLEHRQNPNEDVVPTSVRSMFHCSSDWRRYESRSGTRIDRSRKRGISRDVVRRAAEDEGNEAVLRLVHPNITWERITDIVEGSIVETFAIEVDRFHTYLAEDVIVHNSALIAEALPLFLFGRDPTLRIKMISHSDDMAGARVQNISQYITESNDYKQLFPNVKPHPKLKWTQSEIFLERSTRARDASLQAKGIMSKITGARADVLIGDDINDENNTLANPADRPKVFRKFIISCLNPLTPSGRVAIVMCMPGYTRVMMADGTWKSISDIRPGDVVKSYEEGRLTERVVTHFVPQGVATVLEIKTGNHTVRATPNHPFLVEGRGWIAAEELRKGDRLITIGRWENESVSNADVSCEDAWALGFMYGDGWITHHPNKYGSMRWATCVAKSEYPELNERILAWFESRFGARPKLTRFGYYRTEVAAVGRWLEAHGFSGTAKTKRIPDCVFQWPLSHRESFVFGYAVDSDGCIDRFERAHLRSANKNLVHDVKLLAHSCGFRVSNITSQTRMYHPPHSPKPIQATNYHVSFSLRNRDLEPFSVATVRSIERLSVDEPVYDLTVDGSANFIAEGLVVHNTRWHDEDLYGYIMNDENMRRRYGWLIQRIMPECENIQYLKMYPEHPIYGNPGRLDNILAPLSEQNVSI